MWAGAVLIPEFPGTTLADFSFAVPNGVMLGGSAKSRGRYVNFLKAQGLKPGVSDVMVALPRGPYHGAFMEFKRDDGSKISDEQRKWIDRMNKVGYLADIVVGFHNAQKFAQAYLRS